jgi:transposase-like protein
MPGITKAGGEWNDRDKADVVARVLNGSLDVQEACAQYGLSVESLRDWVLSFRRSAIRAFDQHLKDTLFSGGIEVGDVAPAGFTGTLDDISIADLVQTMTLGRRDSVITISHDGGESRIWCTAGEIVDAESGRLRGEPALYRTLALERGEVTADFSSTRRIRTIHASTSALLLNAARQSDECRRLKEQLGPARYVVGPRVMAAGAKFSAGERDVLRHFYAANAVADALVRAETGDLENLKVISQLVAKDYLVPDRASDLPPSQPPPREAMSLSPTVMSFLGPVRPRQRSVSRSRRPALASFAALGVLGLAAWLASANGAASSNGRARGPGLATVSAAGAAPLGADDREPAAATLAAADAVEANAVEANAVEANAVEDVGVEADAARSGREFMNAWPEDGAASRTTPRASPETGAPSSASALGVATSPARAAVAQSPPVRASARPPQRRMASGDSPRASVPRMQIIEEQPLRMQIVE